MTTQVHSGPPVQLDSIEAAVELMLDRIDGPLQVGAPLGLGKPHGLLNALYARVKANPSRPLRLYTALSLDPPAAGKGLEGRFLGLPAIAVSLVSRDHVGEHYATAARAAAEIMQRLSVDPLPADTILNVNVPDRPWEELEGFEVSRLGHRHRAEPCIPQLDPRGRPVWWIGPAGREQDAGPGTDFHAVRRGFISITPLHVDLTRYQALEKVASWVGGLSAEIGKRR